MILLVDIGNTRIKWAYMSNGTFEYGGALIYAHDNFLTLLSSIWAFIEVPERIIVSNVAGDKIARLLYQWNSEHLQSKIQFATTKKQELGVTNAYTNPEQFGIDRWMSMLAIWQEYQTKFCLVDCGSAITFDAVDGQGKHLGGLILPGIDLMQTTLIEKLPGCQQAELNKRLQNSLLANNTFHAMSGGCLYAAVAFIDQLTSDISEELGDPMQCIITGGSAQKILPLLQFDYRYKPHLVLKGLALID